MYVLENKETGQVNITQTEVKLAKHALYDKMSKISEKTERIGEDKKLDDIEYKNIFSKVEDLMSERLSEDEKQILLLRFGIDGSGSKSLDEVSQKLGITPERVRILEKKALRKLKGNEELKEMSKELGHSLIEEPDFNKRAI